MTVLSIARPAASAPAGRVGWLAAPAVGYLAVVYALPLLWLLSRSLVGPDGVSVSLFVTFFNDPYSWRVIGNTLRIAVLVTVLCLALGFPVAVAMSRAGPLMQGVLLVPIILPLSVGVVVKAFAWQIVLRRDGVVAQALVGSGLLDEAPRLLFTETGLVVGAANVFLPFMVLPIYALLRLVDPRLGDAGATLGASPLYRFRHILLPLAMPGIISGVAFVFSMSVSMFVIPSLLIGDRFQTLATLTGRSFLLMRNEALGSTTAVVLLALSIAIVVSSAWAARRIGRVA